MATGTPSVTMNIYRFYSAHSQSNTQHHRLEDSEAILL